MSVEQNSLKQYTLFNDLNETQLSAIAELCQESSFDMGNTIFKEGKPGTSIFFITEGEVDLLFRIGNEGGARVDKTYAGGIIGCSILFSPYSYNATARCVTNVKALSMDVGWLKRLFEQDSSLAVVFYENLVQSLLLRIVILRLESGK